MFTTMATGVFSYCGNWASLLGDEGSLPSGGRILRRTTLHAECRIRKRNMEAQETLYDRSLGSHSTVDYGLVAQGLPASAAESVPLRVPMAAV